MVATFAELESIGLAAGLCAVGITSADPFPAVRVDLEARKARGLDAGMQFTYRNPARSTDPDRSLAGATTVRTLLEGQPVTMEYAYGRLNLIVNRQNVITLVRCG